MNAHSFELGPIEAKGTNGTIQFDGSTVTLVRTGMGRLLFGGGTKRIPLRSITAIQWRKAGIGGGYMSFTLAGGIEVRARSGRAASDAMHDENSITFHATQEPRMERVYWAISDAIDRLDAQSAAPAPVIVYAPPPAPIFAPAPTPAPPLPSQRLRELLTMLNDGVITAGEYDRKRAEILAEL